MTGRLVISIHDDSDCPLVGRIIRQVDDEGELVEVAWGDSDETVIEAADELTSRGNRNG